MAGQENIIIDRYRYKRPKFLASMIAMAGLIVLMSTVISMGKYNISAQMKGDHVGIGNMTSDPVDFAKANTSLAQAITTAEQSVGNNSFAFMAFGGRNQSHIFLGTPGMEFYDVMVDAGNGQILTAQETSKKEMEKMHLEHSIEVVRSGGNDSAQMMMGDSDGIGNMTPGLLDFAKANTSLAQAITTAEQSVGNNSFASMAFGGNQSGSLVYRILLGTPGMEFYNVTVDPGNGQILTAQETSKKEIEKMHLEHSIEDVRRGAGIPFLH